MNGSAPVGETAAEVRLTPLSVPGGARRARQSLAPAVRAKLERLESAAEAANVLARVTQSRVRDVRDELRALERTLADVRANPYRQTGHWRPAPESGPTARVWVPGEHADPAALEGEIAQVTGEVERLTREAESASSRAQANGRVAERARHHLGL